MDYDLFFLGGDRNDRLAFRARSLLTGELLAHIETLLAARADDWDRHGAGSLQ
jgi:hypothetical protein